MQAACGLCRVGRRSLWETNGTGGQMALMSQPAGVSAGCTHRAPPPSPASRGGSSCFSTQGSRRVEGWHVGQCTHVASDFPQHGARWAHLKIGAEQEWWASVCQAKSPRELAQGPKDRAPGRGGRATAPGNGFTVLGNGDVCEVLLKISAPSEH